MQFLAEIVQLEGMGRYAVDEGGVAGAQQGLVLTPDGGGVITVGSSRAKGPVAGNAGPVLALAMNADAQRVE